MPLGSSGVAANSNAGAHGVSWAKRSCCADSTSSSAENARRVTSTASVRRRNAANSSSSSGWPRGRAPTRLEQRGPALTPSRCSSRGEIRSATAAAASTCRRSAGSRRSSCIRSRSAWTTGPGSPRGPASRPARGCPRCRRPPRGSRRARPEGVELDPRGEQLGAHVRRGIAQRERIRSSTRWITRRAAPTPQPQAGARRLERRRDPWQLVCLAERLRGHLHEARLVEHVGEREQPPPAPVRGQEATGGREQRIAVESEQRQLRLPASSPWLIARSMAVSWSTKVALRGRLRT